jgi:hypothetical protein
MFKLGDRVYSSAFKGDVPFTILSIFQFNGVVHAAIAKDNTNKVEYSAVSLLSKTRTEELKINISIGLTWEGKISVTAMGAHFRELVKPNEFFNTTVVVRKTYGEEV